MQIITQLFKPYVVEIHETIVLNKIVQGKISFHYSIVFPYPLPLLKFH